jgi:hypothetical protein
MGEYPLLIVISDISERCARNESTLRGLKPASRVGAYAALKRRSSTFVQASVEFFRRLGILTMWRDEL